MIVNHHGVEFGYELISVIPYAYWLYENNMLEGTVSHNDTKEIYYFSRNHKEILGKRHSKHVRTCMKEGLIPNIFIHVKRLNEKQWSPPPYNIVYKNDQFHFDAVVCNKYNVELGGKPVNYYPPEQLIEIFEQLKGKNVLYSHMTKEMGYDDKVESLELNEWDVVRQYPNVTTIQAVISETGFTYNHAQLMIYANAELFITLQGGSSIFASYFGGTNIIYAVVGHELKCGAFNNWYHKFSGSEVVHCTEYNDVITKIKEHVRRTNGV